MQTIRWLCGIELHLVGLQSHQAALIIAGIAPLKIVQDLRLQTLCPHTSARTVASGHLPALWADEDSLAEY